MDILLAVAAFVLGGLVFIGLFALFSVVTRKLFKKRS